MKLISKTIIYYLLISLPLLLIAGFLSYQQIDSELKDGTDEALSREKAAVEKIIDAFRGPQTLYLNYDSLSYIQPVNAASAQTRLSDTSIFDTGENEDILYRKHISTYTSNGNTYRIVICKNTLEEEELMEGLLAAFAFIIGFLVIAFFIVNWLIAKKLWKPFYKTLGDLNNYDIRRSETQVFEPAATLEFEQLNTALNKMTEKIHSDFNLQKEFTENASHEMQTPLAVVKANLSLLMQSPNLKEEEMDQLQTIENTLKKLSALNKTLILLTKIENNQFKEKNKIDVAAIIERTIKSYADILEAKKIELQTQLSPDAEILMDPVLAEILVSNLFQNAIRHNHDNGKIIISMRGNTLTVSNSGDPLTINTEDLFVRFKKNDVSKESLGLGLSIVKSIMDVYSGSIVYSYQNKLHTFEVRFS